GRRSCWPRSPSSASTCGRRGAPARRRLLRGALEGARHGLLCADDALERAVVEHVPRLLRRVEAGVAVLRLVVGDADELLELGVAPLVEGLRDVLVARVLVGVHDELGEHLARVRLVARHHRHLLDLVLLARCGLAVAVDRLEVDAVALEDLERVRLGGRGDLTAGLVARGLAARRQLLEQTAAGQQGQRDGGGGHGREQAGGTGSTVHRLFLDGDPAADDAGRRGAAPETYRRSGPRTGRSSRIHPGDGGRAYARTRAHTSARHDTPTKEQSCDPAPPGA